MEDTSVVPAFMTGHPSRHAARTERMLFSCGILLTLLVLAAACITAPVQAAALTNTSAGNPSTSPVIVHIGTYIMDISGYDAEKGTFEASFYVSLKSDSPVNISDFEIINGHSNAIGILIDTPGEKYYRIFATLTADPDFHKYPFDQHTLSIITEPRTRDEREIVFVIDENETGIDRDVRIPGWELGDSHAVVVNHSYADDPFPYSRAVFSYDIARDSFSTFLKFFLPVMLILIVSLSSLMMKVTSRLGLNASMFVPRDPPLAHHRCGAHGRLCDIS